MTDRFAIDRYAEIFGRETRCPRRWRMPDVLIVGATGMVGRAVIERFGFRIPHRSRAPRG